MGIKQSIINNIDNVDSELLEKLYRNAFDSYYEQGSEFARGIDLILGFLAGSLDEEELPTTKRF